MRYLLAALASVVLVSVKLLAQAPIHPLDGLSGREHWTIYDALVASGRTDTSTNYLYVGLNEPPSRKSSPGARVSRSAAKRWFT